MIAIALMLFALGALGIYRGNSRGTNGLGLILGGLVVILLGAVGIVVAAVRFIVLGD